MRVAVFGASGYTGLELLRILLRHPRFELAVVTSEQRAGEPVGDAFPSLRGLLDLRFTALGRRARASPARSTSPSPRSRTRPRRPTVAALRKAGVPVARPLGGLPAARSGASTASGTASTRRRSCWPGASTGSPSSTARRCARPSWWPSPAATRPRRCSRSRPSCASGWSRPAGIVDRLEVRRLGRRPQARGAATCSPSSTRTACAYKPGHAHRHAPEIEQEASAVAGEPVRVSFVPHLLPEIRGIVTSVYAAAARRALRRARRARCSRAPTPASASCACCRRARRRASQPCAAATSATSRPSPTSATAR